MNQEQKICYIHSLHRILNIPIIYKSKTTKYDFQPFSIGNAEKDWNFIYQRLSNVFINYSDSNTLYFVHKSLIMFGMVINRQTEEFVFIGPIASTLATEQEITDYLFMSEISEDTARSVTNYLKANCKFTLEQIQELIININLIINQEIATEDMLVSIYDREKITKEKLATRIYSQEDDIMHRIDMEQMDNYTNRLTQCIINGDSETLNDLLLQLNNIPFNERDLRSLSEVRTAAIGSIYVAHSIARKSNIDFNELERVKHYYLMKVSTCQKASEINYAAAQALIEFTQTIKKNKSDTTRNPTVNRVIKYIQANITSKLQASEIAGSLNISTNYLFMKFKAETGKTLTQYINEEKVKKAMYYLTFTDKSLAEISNHLSFSSQSYFQTVFKNITGQTPASYRDANHS